MNPFDRIAADPHHRLDLVMVRFSRTTHAFSTHHRSTAWLVRLNRTMTSAQWE